MAEGRSFTLDAGRLHTLVFSTGLVVAVADTCGTLVGRHTTVPIAEVSDVVTQLASMV